MSPSADAPPRRTVRDVAVAAEAAVLLLSARVAVATLPFAVIGRVLGVRTTSVADVGPPQRAAPAVVRCSWAVGAARRRIPGPSTCLTEAIVGQLMLRRRLVPATVVFGLACRDGEWCNHAWLEVAGRAVIGGPDIDQYTRTVEYSGTVRRPRRLSVPTGPVSAPSVRSVRR